MVSSKHSPDDPRAWLERAQSNLIQAKTGIPGVFLVDLLFGAQQAAEKAIKAVFIRRQIAFPYVHDLAELLARLEHAGEEIPENVKMAEELTIFATVARYPDDNDEVTEEEYLAAVAIAEAVVS